MLFRWSCSRKHAGVFLLRRAVEGAKAVAPFFGDGGELARGGLEGAPSSCVLRPTSSGARAAPGLVQARATVAGLHRQCAFNREIVKVGYLMGPDPAVDPAPISDEVGGADCVNKSAIIDRGAVLSANTIRGRERRLPLGRGDRVIATIVDRDADAHAATMRTRCAASTSQLYNPNLAARMSMPMCERAASEPARFPRHRQATGEEGGIRGARAPRRAWHLRGHRVNSNPGTRRSRRPELRIYASPRRALRPRAAQPAFGSPSRHAVPGARAPAAETSDVLPRHGDRPTSRDIDDSRSAVARSACPATASSRHG